MRLNQLIKILNHMQDMLVDYNPMVVISKDEEGNAFHELYEVELTDSIFYKTDCIILWPAGEELEI